MTLIDLDRPEAEPEARRPGKRLAVGAVVLVVAGVVVGGLVTDRWQVRRQQDANRSVVSVVLLPDPLARPDDGTDVNQTDDKAIVQVELAAHVDVVNAGPEPVRFVGFRADQQGLELRGDAAPTAALIAPGDFAVGTVHASVICAVRPPGDPVSVTASVLSADGVLRQPTVTVAWRVWADEIAEVCDSPAPGAWSRR